MTVEQLRRRADEQNLDAGIATSFENVCYLTGAVIYTQFLIPERLAAVVVPMGDGSPTFVVCTIEESFAAQESDIEDIRSYEEFNESPIAVMAEALTEKGLGAGRIGVEMRALTMSDFLELERHLPEAKLEPVDSLFDRMRMRKQPHEIDQLSEIYFATDQAIRQAYELAQVGSTEVEVLSTIVDVLMDNGADYLPFLNLGAGPNAFHTHPFATDYAIAPGDVIRCDVGGRFGGYYSDLARTAVAGEASDYQIQRYNNLWEIHEAVIAAAKPGVLASDLFHLCAEEFRKRDMVLSLSHIGHSVGLGLHERPMICPTDDTPLQEGMMLAIEPATRDETSVFHVEDLVEITADGSRVLSRSADWSKLFVIS